MHRYNTIQYNTIPYNTIWLPLGVSLKVISFIHIEHLYSASSRKLLRSAPNTSTVKQSSLKVRKNAGEVVLLKMRSSEGRPFQVEGPTTEKAKLSVQYSVY